MPDIPGSRVPVPGGSSVGAPADLTIAGTLACLANAMSSPTRLKILKLIQEEELCVCELAAILGVSQPAVSQHLVKLRQAGLAIERKAGPMALYRAAGVGERILSALRAWLELAPGDCAELEGWGERLAAARLKRTGMVESDGAGAEAVTLPAAGPCPEVRDATK